MWAHWFLHMEAVFAASFAMENLWKQGALKADCCRALVDCRIRATHCVAPTNLVESDLLVASPTNEVECRLTPSAGRRSHRRALTCSSSSAFPKRGRVGQVAPRADRMCGSGVDCRPSRDTRVRPRLAGGTQLASLTAEARSVKITHVLIAAVFALAGAPSCSDRTGEGRERRRRPHGRAQ